MQCTIGSMPELGIGIAACAHLAVAAPDLIEPMDGGNIMRFANSLIRENLDVAAGSIAPFDAPGLGVTLDEQQLAKVRVDRQ